MEPISQEEVNDNQESESGNNVWMRCLCQWSSHGVEKRTKPIQSISNQKVYISYSKQSHSLKFFILSLSNSIIFESMAEAQTTAMQNDMTTLMKNKT